MKIGILTWHYAMNYGAKAHTSALHHYLLEHGYDVEVVNFSTINGYLTDLRSVTSKNPVKLFRGLRHYFFVQKNNAEYQIGKRVNLEEISLSYDIIILGSDEVFNVLSPCFNKVYMGVGLSCRLMTYAVSCGQSCNEILDNDCISSIRRIEYISVRDSSTGDLIKKNSGKDSMVVLDPTFLWDKTDHALPQISDYILIYAFSPLDDIRDKIMDYARATGKQVVRICDFFNSCKWVDCSVESPTLDEWYGFFSNAALVITDSYHGVVFAIKNRKRFIAYKKDDKENKILGLYEKLGIQRQFYDGSHALQDSDFEDYSLETVDEMLEIARNESKRFLTDAISKLSGGC